VNIFENLTTELSCSSQWTGRETSPSPTVCKYTHTTRLVLERLRIIVVHSPILYNDTNHIASIFCGPDVHSVVLYLLSTRSQIVYFLRIKWRLHQEVLNFKYIMSSRYTRKCNLNYSRNKSTCFPYASFFYKIYTFELCTVHRTFSEM
jgi:hypothetical protein